MPPKTVQGNQDLGKKIRQRRNELGLTIKEAAGRAGVGIKTWCRYEAGESMRFDKCKGICKALEWPLFPDVNVIDKSAISLDEYRTHEAWSDYFEKNFGVQAAISFDVGSDLLLDYINEDMCYLAYLPSGSHIGELDSSWLKDSMPPQFLMHYNYEFLFKMKCILKALRRRAKSNLPMVAHTVVEELIIYLCSEKSKAFLEIQAEESDFDLKKIIASSDWPFDLFEDMDVYTWLYSDIYLDEDHPYHFSHWFEDQFFNGGV